MIRAIGIDFGTTNSVVALLREDGSVTTQRRASLDVFRSVLCFWTEDTPARRVLRHEAGPEAITAYLEDPLDSRLIMSMKTYLAQRSFSETRIFNQPFTLERLVGRFLAALLADTPSAPRIIVGRPVRFAGEFADDALGADRLCGAYTEAGLSQVTLALEPEAAGDPVRPHTYRTRDRADRRLRWWHQRFLHSALRPEAPGSRRSATRASASPAMCSTSASSTAPSPRCSARATLTASWARPCPFRPSITPASPAGTCCR